MKLAFIGLGVIGYPMAGHLASAGHEMFVYNRTASTAARWCDDHVGMSFARPAGAAEQSDIVLMCVGNDDDVRQCVFGNDGALNAMSPGTILVDHTTTSAELARELASACADKGVGFIDAPVSGGQAGAENGALTVMAGGAQAHYDIAAPVLAAYSKKAALMGDAGSGQLAKMVNQICIAGLVQGLAEGLNFAQLAGLDGAQVIEVISKGAAQSWQMENRFETMLAGDYEHGFAVEWMLKDLRYAMAEADRQKAELPVTELVSTYYQDVADIGGSRWDTSSLLARLQSRRYTGEPSED